MCLLGFSYGTSGKGCSSARIRTGLMASSTSVEVSAQVLGFNFHLKLISVKEVSLKDMGGMVVAAKVEVSR